MSLPVPRGRRAAITVLIVCAVFLGFVLSQVRRGCLTDHHVRREQRRLPLLITLAAIAGGLAILLRLDAPRDLLALLVAIIAGAVVCLLITLAWKTSINTGTVAATGLILAIILGPSLLALELLAALVAWARVELRVHTPAQVIGGGIIGAAVPAIVFLTLR